MPLTVFCQGHDAALIGPDWAWVEVAGWLVC